MKVINIAGGPGCGKSTTAAGLFNIMKLQGFRVELVTEVAKDLTWDEAYKVRSNQLRTFALQDHSLRRLKGKRDYVITDSPLWLSLLYCDKEEFPEWFSSLVWSVFGEYDNLNFFLRRTKPYSTEGRTENEEEARLVDLASRRLFWDRAKAKWLASHEVDGDELAPLKLLEMLRRTP
jgi:ABC-type oligopeptide transport system ATPase subunit